VPLLYLTVVVVNRAKLLMLFKQQATIIQSLLTEIIIPLSLASSIAVLSNIQQIYHEYSGLIKHPNG